jgi:copper resistance protein C
MTKRLLLALAAVLAVLIPATPAWAHNALVEATPAKNATLKTAPAAVKLRFLEKLPDSTTLSGAGADGTTPAQSAAKISGATISVTFDEPLPNGAYTVAYQVAGGDGHLTKSTYEFTVAAPVSSSAASASASASAAPSPALLVSAAPVSVAEDDGGDGPWLGLAAGIGILVLAGAAGFVFLRRRAAK